MNPGPSTTKAFSPNSKDFKQVLSTPSKYSDFNPKALANQPSDPNIYTNSAVLGEILNKTTHGNFFTIAAMTISSVFTSPLLVASTLLQLSVLPHANLYGDTSATHHNNMLANIPKEITIQDKRRYELIVKSGMTSFNKPFRAPIHSSYKEAFQAMANQGILGYYKGNAIGLVHKSLILSLKTLFTLPFDYGNIQLFAENIFARSLILGLIYTGIDILLHPLELFQSRFILQNRLPNFRTYRSLRKIFIAQFYKNNNYYVGWRAHLPKNIIMGATYINLVPGNPVLSILLANYIGFTLTYPLMTAMRRVMCQAKDPGMIPIRYEGVWHGLRLIFQEEGIRGLYRGFAGYSVVNAATILIGLFSKVIGEQHYESNFDQQLKL